MFDFKNKVHGAPLASKERSMLTLGNRGRGLLVSGEMSSGLHFGARLEKRRQGMSTQTLGGYFPLKFRGVGGLGSIETVESADIRAEQTLGAPDDVILGAEARRLGSVPFDGQVGRDRAGQKGARGDVGERFVPQHHRAIGAADMQVPGPQFVGVS